ncbi:UNVERIFIED_CONTAM: hypothetical protein FKN15_008736 [Acipenser sinensis]
MACTMQKILGDARTLLERLKEHDMAAESLVEQSGALNQRVEGMREVGTALPDKVGAQPGGRRAGGVRYAERPLKGLDSSNRKFYPDGWIRREESEKCVYIELWLSLEEHQYALELIMGKYRKQMLLFMTAKKKMDTKPVLSLHQEHSKVQ